ncbi:MAG: polysaccharide biosynthesis/export family protein [Deltaproteobacteria bacterium]|nr:polysaccharide biosynthesis/export family protein [Deltaproteobacteria bacterium]
MTYRLFCRSTNTASLWLLLAIAALLGGCATTQGKKAPPLPLITPDRVAVESGDVLTIEVFGEKNLSGKFQVSSEGTIDYPLVGRIHVAGKAPEAVSSLLKTKLAAGYLKAPHVAVFAEGYAKKRKVFVWGQVRKSGTFDYTSNMTVIEALTLAGGVTPLADKNGISIMRIENGQRKRYSLPMGSGQSSSYPLRPGDVVFVPERVF